MLNASTRRVVHGCRASITLRPAARCLGRHLLVPTQAVALRLTRPKDATFIMPAPTSGPAPPQPLQLCVPITAQDCLQLINSATVNYTNITPMTSKAPTPNLSSSLNQSPRQASRLPPFQARHGRARLTAHSSLNKARRQSRSACLTSTLRRLLRHLIHLASTTLPSFQSTSYSATRLPRRTSTPSPPAERATTYRSQVATTFGPISAGFLTQRA